jgi:hypothetical protein
MNAEIARKCHRTLEAYHGFIYFAPQAQREYATLGLEPADAFKGYFASRAAALGAVPGEVVLATFFNFHRDLVLAAVPSCWQVAAPGQWVAARLRAVDLGLREVLGDSVDGAEVHEAFDLARAAASACDVAGRPLFAGHASLPWPDAPHLGLWHAITLLREFRGDGHISLLVDASIAPCEALVLHQATGDLPPGVLQRTRAWPDDEWEAARTRLQDRGWIDGDELTAEGSAARDEIEQRTDELAMAPWEALGEARCQRLRDVVRPLSKAIVGSGLLSAGLP